MLHERGNAVCREPPDGRQGHHPNQDATPERDEGGCHGDDFLGPDVSEFW